MNARRRYWDEPPRAAAALDPSDTVRNLADRPHRKDQP